MTGERDIRSEDRPASRPLGEPVSVSHRLPNHFAFPPLVHIARQNYTGNSHGGVAVKDLGYGTANACQSGAVLQRHKKLAKPICGSKAFCLRNPKLIPGG
jgi:hypothetical protein